MHSDFLLTPKKVHDDLRLLEVASKKRWDISEDFRHVIVQRLRSIVEEGDDETAIKAINQVKALEAMNQKDEQHEDDKLEQGRNRVLDLLARARATDGDKLLEPGGSGVAGVIDGQPSSRTTITENQGR